MRVATVNLLLYISHMHAAHLIPRGRRCVTLDHGAAVPVERGVGLQVARSMVGYTWELAVGAHQTVLFFDMTD